MNQSLKLFFDECCSKRLACKIVEIYSECYPSLQTKHLTDFFRPGSDDPDWVAVLERDKGWVVLTADRGKDPKKQKLPVVCAKLKVTHISLTPAVCHAGYKEHKQALLSLWPQITQTPLLPRGTRVSLGWKTIDKGTVRVPWLSIQNKAFGIWCREQGVQISI